jgi:single-strand DNA-binding protein
MNKVILMGRLTRDPEVRYSQGENPIAVARYTLAIDRRYKKDGDEQTADFIRCVAFGKNGEFAEKYLHQGNKIAIVGRIQTGSYTDKDGNKVYTTEVVIEEHYFCESKASSSYESSARPEPESAYNEGFMNIPDGVEDEELPFN